MECFLDSTAVLRFNDALHNNMNWNKAKEKERAFQVEFLNLQLWWFQINIHSVVNIEGKILLYVKISVIALCACHAGYLRVIVFVYTKQRVSSIFGQHLAYVNKHGARDCTVSCIFTSVY